MGRRVVFGLCLLLGSAFTITILSGCGDESKQTGTQVLETEKDKAVVDSMRDDMLKQNKERSK